MCCGVCGDEVGICIGGGEGDKRGGGGGGPGGSGGGGGGGCGDREGEGGATEDLNLETLWKWESKTVRYRSWLLKIY